MANVSTYIIQNYADEIFLQFKKLHLDKKIDIFALYPKTDAVH